MNLTLIKRVQDKFQAPAKSAVNIAVRSASGNVTLSDAYYPDSASKCPQTDGSATLTIVQGSSPLSVAATPLDTWEDWWIVEVDNGVDSPPIEHGSGYAGGQWVLQISIKGI
jgi:hypothetical protein